MAEELRPLLFSIAYRMLGSVGDAEDIVQEALERLQRTTAGGTAVQSERAFLTTVTTRLAIDQLRSARRRRETYFGPWLPEPLLTAAEPGPAELADMSDSLSLAFLVLLETLTPVERAVFLLREVFDYGYDEIARTIGKSEQNCRQLAARARKQIEVRRPRFEASRERKEELARRFFAAADRGDTEGLVGMLAADVVSYGDGGGRAFAFPRPVYGRDAVARLLAGLRERVRSAGVRWRHAEINGQPGALFFDVEDRILFVVSLDIAEDQIQTIRAVNNPEKLGHLGPVGDPQYLLRG